MEVGSRKRASAHTALREHQRARRQPWSMPRHQSVLSLAMAPRALWLLLLHTVLSVISLRQVIWSQVCLCRPMPIPQNASRAHGQHIIQRHVKHGSSFARFPGRSPGKQNIHPNIFIRSSPEWHQSSLRNIPARRALHATAIHSMKLSTFY